MKDPHKIEEDRILYWSKHSVDNTKDEELLKYTE